MIQELKKSHVCIKRKEIVLEKISKLIQGGKDRLQVVADFDRTLSKYRHNGTLVNTCHNSLDTSPYLPDWYGKKALALRDKYYPLETDPKLTSEEKFPLMVEWWSEAHDLLMKAGVTRQILEQTVQQANIILRDGIDVTFEELDKHRVPLLIFSAGIGDVIEAVLRQQYKMYENIRIISNYMTFGENGLLNGFKGNTIHVYNKNDHEVRKSDYFEVVRHRQNILLIGDSLGDLKMANGSIADVNLVTVGFLNDNVAELLPAYSDAYDIVLVQDETMDVPNALLREIIKGSSQECL